MEIERRDDEFTPFRLWLKFDTKAEAEEFYALFNCSAVTKSLVAVAPGEVREAISINYHNEKRTELLAKRIKENANES